MENVEQLTVGGYIFASYEDAEAASNEIKKISYIETHTDMSKVSNVKALYDKALETRAFATPIGLEYMHSLQNILKDSGYAQEDVKPIPLYSTFHRISLNKEEKVPRRVTMAQKKEMSLRMKYRNAVLIAVIFGILSVSMLLITFNGTTPNAINYKKAITNQYASWEQELTQRENVIREKERELNISSDN